MIVGSSPIWPRTLSTPSSYSLDEDYKEEKFRKLFVGGLSPKTDESSLGAFFSKWGEIVDCVVMKDPQKKRSRGFGFITYRDPNLIDVAQSFRPHEIDGKLVESKRAMPREDSRSPEAHLTVNKIYIADLPRGMHQSSLYQYFSQYGTIKSFELATVGGDFAETCTAYLEYDDYDSVDKTILHRPHTVTGYELNVRKALSPEQINLIRAKHQSLHLEGYMSQKRMQFQVPNNTPIYQAPMADAPPHMIPAQQQPPPPPQPHHQAPAMRQVVRGGNGAQPAMMPRNQMEPR